MGEEEFAVELPSLSANGSYVVLDNITASTTTLSDSNEGRPLDKTLWIFISPVIFVLGICGNILILLVMSKKRMRGTTTSVYLRFMAVADLIFVFGGIIPEWLEKADIIKFSTIHPATCKLEKFIHYTTGDISIWILVIFTVDRFIAVCFPLEKRDYCLASRAKFYALGAIGLAMLKNAHVFGTRGATYVLDSNNITVLESNCGRVAYYFEKKIRPWIVLVVVDAIPFLVIVFCNIFIIRALVIVKRLRSEQAIVSNNDRQLVQMSLMCLSASFAFLVCITPSIILLIGKDAWAANNKSYDIAKAINNQLVYVNHSINFFLYCITGKRFRRVLARMFSRSDSGSPQTSNDSNFRTTVYRTTLPTAKINKNSATSLLPKGVNASPRSGDRSLSRTPETSPFMMKKVLKAEFNERHESSL